MSAVAPTPSDPELVRRSLAGEAGAFAQLVEKHQRLVFGVALARAGDVAQAEDVAQEAFVEAWRELPRLRDPARVGSWIAGIARNLSRGWQRRTARRRRREAAVGGAAQDAVATPLDHALARETQVLLQGALAEIPEAFRETLVLFYVHGRSVAEVASGLGISEDLVKQRLSRGRRALRATLEEHVEHALAQLAPSKVFVTSVMVGVGTATAGKAAAANVAGTAGKVIVGMNASKVAMIGTAVVVAGGVGWYGLTSGASDPPLRRTGSAAPAPAVASRDPGETGRTVNVRRLANREARDQLLGAIRAARDRAAAATAAVPAVAPSAPARAPGAAPASTTIDDTSGEIDKAYVRDAVRGLLPLLVDCYSQALEATPALAGRLVVHFTIEGEPDVGGLVTESSIDPEESEIADPAMVECVQETMFALEIDPPTNGGTVEVTYPFEFHPRE